MPVRESSLPPVQNNMKVTQYDDVAAAAASSGQIYIIASDGVVIDPDSSKFELNEDPQKERFMKLPSIPEVNSAQQSDSDPTEEKTAPKWHPAKIQRSISNTKLEETDRDDAKETNAEDSEYEYSVYKVTKERRRFLYISLVIVFALIALAIIYAAVKSAHEVPPR